MLSLSACIRQGGLGGEEVGRLLSLRGIIDQPASSTGTRREAFSGFGLLSSYRLIDFGDVVPWSFNTQFANPPFKASALKCKRKEKGKKKKKKKKKYSLRNGTGKKKKDDEEERGRENH